jgi:hypothetical protein
MRRVELRILRSHLLPALTTCSGVDYIPILQQCHATEVGCIVGDGGGGGGGGGCLTLMAPPPPRSQYLQ